MSPPAKQPRQSSKRSTSEGVGRASQAAGPPLPQEGPAGNSPGRIGAGCRGGTTLLPRTERLILRPGCAVSTLFPSSPVVDVRGGGGSEHLWCLTVMIWKQLLATSDPAASAIAHQGVPCLSGQPTGAHSTISRMPSFLP